MNILNKIINTNAEYIIIIDDSKNKKNKYYILNITCLLN